MRFLGAHYFLESPTWLAVFGAAAIASVIAHAIWTRSRRFQRVEISMHAFGKMRRRWVGTHVPIALAAAALIVMGAALARPYTYGGEARIERRGIDIMMALDISQSMLAEDFKPNRLEAAKITIDKLTRRLTNDRIGLIIFAGETFPQYPLSFDHALLRQFLPYIQMGVLRDGTAIGMAIAQAVDRLKASDSGARSRVIVLLTDGDNNAGSITPMQAAAMAAAEKIPVYTVAIGREGAVPYPVYVTDGLGRRLKQYRMMQDTINHALLNDIARVTGGRYAHAEDTDGLVSVVRDIQKIEKSKLPVIEPVGTRHYHDHSLIWLAFIFFVLSFLAEKWWVRVMP